MTLEPDRRDPATVAGSRGPVWTTELSRQRFSVCEPMEEDRVFERDRASGKDH